MSNSRFWVYWMRLWSHWSLSDIVIIIPILKTWDVISKKQVHTCSEYTHTLRYVTASEFKLLCKTLNSSDICEDSIYSLEMESHRKNMTWAFIVKLLYGLPEQCCINVFRMSWVWVRFSGTMAWLIHACTLPPFVSLFLSLSNTNSTDSTHLIFLLYLFSLQAWLFPHCHTSTLCYKAAAGYVQSNYKL